MSDPMRPIRFILFSILLQRPFRGLLDCLWDEGMSMNDWGRHLAVAKNRLMRWGGMAVEPGAFLASGIQVTLPSQCNIWVNTGSFIGKNCFFGNQAPITLGRGCLVANDVRFLTASHRTEDLVYEAKPVTVGDGVWIGAGALILPGVCVGRGCIVGAGSVVTKDLPEFTVCVGNPCRPVRTRALPVRQNMVDGRPLTFEA
ncbi:MAG: hypothetical protein COX57_09825 [Alphaproteobacteria bacterium CG_4_10_14_0_2_um_filter_63_37]|nr:MAG: hypothetical protein AUJ55_02760 [Proteobacteria bacterium CG1_02_64_396]PJA24175.1 MAG: hypothetical protein COX57_09825 [Alphaproteobacteria bacterium CG_4_10_14_0_2_um_filter_63_37]